MTSSKRGISPSYCCLLCLTSVWTSTSLKFNKSPPLPSLFKKKGESPDETFILHLKECEFRFNDRKNNLYAIMVRILRKNPL